MTRDPVLETAVGYCAHDIILTETCRECDVLWFRAAAHKTLNKTKNATETETETENKESV